MDSIIIFDGVCNFCNASINFVMDRDAKKHFKFTANQNKTGQKILKEANISADDVGTIYVLDEGKLYKESSAALRIAKHLNTPWNWLYALIIVPPFIRDFVYRLIAKNRYRIFGKREACRLPSAEEAARFI